MHLLLDVGNTSIKAATLDKDKLTLVNLQSVVPETIDKISFARVGDKQSLEQVLQDYFNLGIDICEITTKPQVGHIKCAYAEFQNLGIDRWLGVIGATQLYPNTNILVIDSGTATKVDAITAQGQHLGGWIIPGMDLMLSSVTSRTQKVFDDEQVSFATEFGCNTPNALKNGVLMSTLGIITMAKTEFKQDALIVFAGGYGELLAQYTKFERQVFHEDLVFWGMKYYIDQENVIIK